MAVFFFMSFLKGLIGILIVGFAFKWLIHRYSWKLSLWKGILILFIVFALDYLCDMMLFSTLKITFTMHNIEMAQAFHLMPDMPLDEALTPHFSDMMLWFVEALIAAGIALGIDRSPCKRESSEKTDTA